jgi:hypothetical protein
MLVEKPLNRISCVDRKDSLSSVNQEEGSNPSRPMN